MKKSLELKENRSSLVETLEAIKTLAEGESRNLNEAESIEVDNTWKPVKDYIRDHIKPGDREKCYFDSYDPAELEQVINTQKKVE